MIEIIKEAVCIKENVTNDNLTAELNTLLGTFKVDEENVIGIQTDIKGVASPNNQGNYYIVTYLITYRGE